MVFISIAERSRHTPLRAFHAVRRQSLHRVPNERADWLPMIKVIPRSRLRAQWRPPGVFPRRTRSSGARPPLRIVTAARKRSTETNTSKRKRRKSSRGVRREVLELLTPRSLAIKREEEVPLAAVRGESRQWRLERPRTCTSGVPVLLALHETLCFGKQWWKVGDNE